MKILMVSWSILPYNGGSSIIVENLAKNFNADELTVLGSKKLFNGKYIDRPDNGPQFKYFWSEMYLLGRGYRYFIWFRKMRFKPLVRYIQKLIKEEQIDYVIGVYPNPFYCLAAAKAARNMGVPFSSYFHNTYTDNVAIRDPDAEEIQEEIFESSEYVFVMNAGMQKYYEEKYKQDNFVPLVHTFNSWPKSDVSTGAPGTGKDHYRLVAIGNFNESNMDATLRFASAVSKHPRYSLSLFTHVPKVLLKRRGLDLRSIEYEGFVRPEEVHRVLQDYDICVLTHGFEGGYGEVEYKTIFPTRTLPLMQSGKPIVAHSPNGSFLNDFIMENKCAELIDTPSAEAIIEGLDKVANSLDYQTELIENSKIAMKQFYGPQVVSKLQQSLTAKSKVENGAIL